jgi:hypothetical protein
MLTAMGTFCRATLQYVGPRGLGDPCPVEVDIHDGRADRTDAPGWRERGFELVDHGSAVQDWTDDDEIARVHYGVA